MENYENKSNNEILLEIKQMELDHEALKLKMLNDFDLLTAIEDRFLKANEVINKRLNLKTK